MRIAHIAPLWLTIPPKDYGGIENMLDALITEQVAQGHDVTLFTCAGSKTAGKQVEVIEKPMFDLLGKFDWSAVQPYEFLTLYEVLNRQGNFDIVHNHMGLHPLAIVPGLRIPIVTTYHSSVAPDYPYLVEPFKNNPFVSISNAQRSVAPELNFIETIYYPLDSSKFEFNDSPQDYYFFMGTLSKNKGIDIAVRAVKELGINLIVAGEVRPEDKEFLDKEFFPFVDDNQIKFVGKVNHEQKVELFKSARAFLFPTQWNEAFGLVMSESMACGTPVIGWRNGSVPEVIADDKTGFIVDNYDDFKDSILKADTLSRKDCRQYVEDRFSAKQIAAEYQAVYERLLVSKN